MFGRLGGRKAGSSKCTCCSGCCVQAVICHVRVFPVPWSSVLPACPHAHRRTYMGGHIWEGIYGRTYMGGHIWEGTNRSLALHQLVQLCAHMDGRVEDAAVCSNPW